MQKLRGVPKDSRANDPRNSWMVSFTSPLATPPPAEPGNKKKLKCSVFLITPKGFGTYETY